jgi:nucleotide-binding universal stress UspA family protein
MNARAPAIVTATDFSAPARHASDRAARLAHETHADLVLVHVVGGDPLADLRHWFGAGASAEQHLLAEAERQLQQLAHELAAARKVTVTPKLVVGSVLDELQRAADAASAGLLVVGARGAGFMRRLVLGTTAERLMRRTTRPVLVVRLAPHERYRRVLVTADFSPWSAHTLAAARRCAPHAHLVLLHAFQVPFEEKLHFAGVDAATIEHYRRRARLEATQQVHALARSAGLAPGQWEPCIVEGDASQRIVEQEQELDCDLVAIGKHGQSAAEDLLLGSTTKHVLSEGSVDVLVATAAAGH